MTVHKGSCHCGRVEFEVNGELNSGVICDCSLCKRKGAITALEHALAAKEDH